MLRKYQHAVLLHETENKWQNSSTRLLTLKIHGSKNLRNSQKSGFQEENCWRNAKELKQFTEKSLSAIMSIQLLTFYDNKKN